MCNLINKILNRTPYVKKLQQELRTYKRQLWVAPGHFYSPLINEEEITAGKDNIFAPDKTIHAVDLYDEEQFQLLNLFKEYYKELPFTEKPFDGNRYYYENEAYSYSDVIFLSSVMLHYKPKRIIEIGSGFSSAAMLDMNEKFFNGSIHLTFIEPYPQLLKTMLKPTDRYTLIEKKIQDVDVTIFSELEENDILFIDSTHIAKTNSDVLFELFEILPLLKKGVKIHFHDIFYPFEYSKEWVLEQKRNWNEIYFLRAFLMYNDTFKILAFNTYLEHRYENWFKEHMPLCLKNKGGSIWFEKVR